MQLAGLLALIAGIHVCVALTSGTVRSISASDLLTWQGQPVAFILAVTLYALVAAMPFVVVALRLFDWRRERALRTRVRPAVDHAIRLTSHER